MEFQKVFISDRASTTKNQANTKLKKNRCRIYAVILILFVSLPLIPITGAIIYGVALILLNNSRGVSWKVKDIFSGFYDFGRSFKLWAWVFSNLLIASLPLLALLGLILNCLLMSQSVAFLYEYPFVSIFGILALLILACTWPMLQLIKYSQAFFLLVDNKGMKPKSAIAGSVNLMKWNERKMLFLILSFLGWVFLIFVLIGIIIASSLILDSILISMIIRILASICLLMVLVILIAKMGSAFAIFYEKLTTRISQKDPKVIFDETIVL